MISSPSSTSGAEALTQSSLEVRSDDTRDLGASEPEQFEQLISKIQNRQSGEQSGQQSNQDEPADDTSTSTGANLAWHPPAAAFGPTLAAAASDIAPASAVWDQLSAYIDQFLVNTDLHGDGPAAIITLAEDFLPGTTLSIARAAEGWVLRVASTNLEVQHQAQSHAAQLQQRFARKSLGGLRVEVQTG